MIWNQMEGRSSDDSILFSISYNPGDLKLSSNCVHVMGGYHLENFDSTSLIINFTRSQMFV